VDEEKPQKLTPDEAGAFVAQWAERNPVSLEELIEKLEIDSIEARRLMSQATGRVSMQKWMAQKKPGKPFDGVSLKAPIVACICAFLLGGFLVFVLMPRFLRGRRPFFGGPSRPTLGSVVGGPGQAIVTAADGTALTRPPFSPVPGDGDPIQRIGLKAGSDLAQLTVNPPSSPTTSSSTGIPQDRLWRKFFGSDPHPNVPLTDLNETLMRSKTPVPSDVFFAVVTPESMYTAYGDLRNNLQLAQRLKLAEVCKVLDAMMAIAIRNSKLPLPPSQLHSMPRGGIMVRIGNAAAFWPLRWTADNRASLENLCKDPNDSTVRTYLGPLIDQIRNSGEALFAKPLPAIKAAK